MTATITFATVGPGIARGTLSCPHHITIVESGSLSLAMATAALIEKHTETGDCHVCVEGLFDRTALHPSTETSYGPPSPHQAHPH